MVLQIIDTNINVYRNISCHLDLYAFLHIFYPKYLLQHVFMTKKPNRYIYRSTAKSYEKS